MVLNKRKAYKNLKKKGFVDSENHGGDHKYLEYTHKGKVVLFTKLSNGSKKDLDNYLISQMSKQCKLSKNDFADLVNCPLSKDDYIKKLKENGILD